MFALRLNATVRFSSPTFQLFGGLVVLYSGYLFIGFVPLCYGYVCPLQRLGRLVVTVAARVNGVNVMLHEKTNTVLSYFAVTLGCGVDGVSGVKGDVAVSAASR